MATTRAAGRGKDATDEEFVQALYRGGELLAAGKVSEAKQHLETAYELQPKNEKAQNLLGLTYFKLGIFDRAAEIYEALVRENPVDPTLRVNLGLVYLKSGALQRAVREFETATDLAPEHAKAQNYLGLALAQQGEYGRAREHFLLAGSEAMAEKMAKAIAGEQFAKSSPLPKGESQGEGGRKVAPPPSREIPPPSSDDENWGDQIGPESTNASQTSATQLSNLVERTYTSPVPPGTPEAELAAAADRASEPEAPDVVVLHPEDAVPPEAVDSVDQAFAQFEETASEASSSEDIELTATGGGEELPPNQVAAELSAEEEFTGRSTAEARTQTELQKLIQTADVFPSARAERFLTTPTGATIRVSGGVNTRIEGLIAIQGHVEFAPLQRRTRGRASEKTFGLGARQMMRASGQGSLRLANPKAHWQITTLQEDSIFFVEDRVSAFEDGILYDNGKISVDIVPDIELVNLRGEGAVLLNLTGSLQSAAISSELPVVVPLERLVGWLGDVSPKVVTLPASVVSAPRVAVELTGEGWALFSGDEE